MRVNYNATIDELEQAAGSCEAQAKSTDDETLAAFLAGASAGIDLLPSCRKPDTYGSLVAVEYGTYMARVTGGEK